MKKVLPLGAALALLVSPPSARAEESAPAPAPRPAASPAAPVVSVPTFENKTCPIMGKPSSKALFTDTDFGRVYVCCLPCVPKIRLDPARAASTAYPVTKKVGNTVDPVTGEPVGASPHFVTLQGHEIALAHERNAARARANAQIVLTKVLNPKVVDVGNRTDPVTGAPVVDNLFVRVDDDLIRLSAASSVEAVRRDPEKARKAAKESAAREAAKARAGAAPAPGAR